VGALKETLGQLLREVTEPCDTQVWLDKTADWKEHYPLHSVNESVLNPQFIMEEIYDLTKGDAIIVTEVGQCQMWGAQYYTYTKPRSFISSGGLGTMGYGFPASLGVKYAHRDTPVFNIAGDGSIQMNIQELATAVFNKLDVNIVIMNNGYLGMVRQWQELFYDKRYAATPLGGNPDFVKLVEAYGGQGARVTKKEELRPALEQALSSGTVNIIDCVIPSEEKVYPMVAPGACIRNMIGVGE
jgi:acetolactate synthase-1/2/3 large subunit